MDSYKLIFLQSSPKTYMLKGDISSDVPTTSVRVRSIPRKVHGEMVDKYFGQDVKANRVCSRYTAMLPTKGLEVIMTNESRSLSHSFNTRRVMTV